jgi:uncharacterized RDD family membrane protein YckC
MERNPYAPPTAKVADVEESPAEFEDASRGQRFANMIIDTIGYYVLAFVFGALIGVVGGLDAANRLAETGVSLVFAFAVMLIYYAPSEHLSGRTLGKLITGTRTVTVDGEKPSVMQILGRTFARMIPLEPFSFLGKKPSGWHDSLSKTRVIRVRSSKR